MSRTRKWSAATAVAVVLLLLAGWFLLVSPKRGEAADLREQALAHEQANDQLVQKIKRLEAQAAELPAQEVKLARFARQMPDNPALPELIRDLTRVAEGAGLELQSIAPAVPEPLLPAESAVIGQATGEQATGEQATGNTVAQGAQDASAATVSAVPVSLTVGGEFPEIELFLNKLEEVERVFLVTGFTLEAGEGASAGSQPTSGAQLDGPLSLQVQGRVFVSAPVAAPAATPTPAPSATGDPSATPAPNQTGAQAEQGSQADPAATPAPEPTATSAPQ